MWGVQMNKKNIRVRKGQAPGKLSRADFRARFFDKFTDPAFGAEASALKRIEIIAWDGYTEHRKAPLTHPAGRGYADPSYDLSDEWRAARQAIRAAETQQKDPASPSQSSGDLGSGPQRRDMPRRNIQDVSAVAHRDRHLERGAHPMR